MVARNPSPHLIILVNCYTITHYLGQKSVITSTGYIAMLSIAADNTLHMELECPNRYTPIGIVPSGITLGAIKLLFYLLIIWISRWGVISLSE